MHVFRQNDIRGVADSELTEAFMKELGNALAVYFDRHQVTTVSLGYDCRLSSPRLKTALAEGLLESGIDVIDIGMGPTPLVYFSLFHLPVGGGIMITGSHNPPNENGLKISLGKTTIYGEEIQAIRRIMAAKDYRNGHGRYASQPLMSEYQKYLATITQPGPRRVKAVVDAGNGTGNIAAVKLYQSLGWEIVELFSEPDGNFPNHHPDPTMPENLEALIAAVRQTGADLGIAFDGDADRIGVVDGRGRILWGDQLLILFAKELLKEHPGGKIIGEVKCSQSLFDSIAKFGGTPIMWKVGHSLIKAKMKAEGALLAGEMSGHLFFADRYYGYDDAIYAGVRLLELLSHSEPSLTELVDALPPTVATPEIRFECPDDRKFTIVAQLIREFESKYPVIAIDGARISFPEGWGLVRASNTQPVLVLRFEAQTQAALAAIETEVRQALARLTASPC